MAKKQAHGLYDESPHIEDDGEGNKKVKKEAKSSGKEPHTAEGEEKGDKDEHFPMHVRHAHERMELHSKHEHEHGLHDAHHKGAHGKEEMHKRHEHEFKALHSKHEKEAGAVGGEMAGEGGAASEPIAKVEKGAKS